jgi:hypothetical protein
MAEKKVTFFQAIGPREGGLKSDDLAQIVTCDRGFAHDVRRALLQDLATVAKVGRKKQPCVAGFQNQALPHLRAG